MEKINLNGSIYINAVDMIRDIENHGLIASTGFSDKNSKEVYEMAHRHIIELIREAVK